MPFLFRLYDLLYPLLVFQCFDEPVGRRHVNKAFLNRVAAKESWWLQIQRHVHTYRARVPREKSLLEGEWRVRGETSGTADKDPA